MHLGQINLKLRMLELLFKINFKETIHTMAPRGKHVLSNLVRVMKYFQENKKVQRAPKTSHFNPELPIFFFIGTF